MTVELVAAWEGEGDEITSRSHFGGDLFSPSTLTRTIRRAFQKSAHGTGDTCSLRQQFFDDVCWFDSG